MKNQIQIVQYPSDSSPKIRLSDKPLEPGFILWKTVELLTYSVPPYDPETQYVEKEEGVNEELTQWVKRWVVKDYPAKPPYDPETQQLVAEGSNADRTWTVVDYTPEELEAKYQASLTWNEFNQLALTSLAYAKLELWGETNIKVNQHFSMLRENSVSIRSEPALKQRLFKLKHALVTDTLAFTAEEEADMENLLIALGVNWTWASL